MSGIVFLAAFVVSQAAAEGPAIPTTGAFTDEASSEAPIETSAFSDEAEIGPEPQPEAELTWIEEALRASAARAAELTRVTTPEWPRPGAAPKPRLQGEASNRVLLARMAASREPDVRLRALEGWVQSGARDIPDALFAALVDPAPKVSTYAAEELARLAADYPEIADRLLEFVLSELTSGKPPRIPRPALEEALDAWAPFIEGPMLEALQTSDQAPGRRGAAAFCLGVMHTTKAKDALLKGVWSGDRPFALACAQALHDLRAPDMTQAWLQLLGHSLPAVQSMAVDALSTLGGAQAADALVQMALKGEDINLAKQATRVLTRWPTQDAIPMLITALEGRPAVNQLAGAILRKRTGATIDPSPEQWQQWWMDYGRFGQRGPSEEEGVTTAPRLYDLETWDQQEIPTRERQALEQQQ